MVDAIVVGAGPNGLAAAITLAQAGRSVRLYEAEPEIGGGMRSAELTQPGYIHDVCSTVHALALVSPFFKTLPLAKHGVEFAQPNAAFAHPLDDGTAVMVHRSVDETVAGLPARDGEAYRALVEPFVRRADDLMEALLRPPSLHRPLLMARFGLHAIRSLEGLASGFRDERTRAMLAGVAAHSMVPLDMLATAGYGLGLIITAHAVGWPVARGGSQQLANALASYLTSLGGEIATGERIQSLEQLPKSRAVLLDVTPRQFLRIAGDKVPSLYAKRLRRYRYGPGVFKMDWALSAAVPWRARECHDAGTLHLGGSLEEIAASERDAWEGRHSERPYVLVVQPSRFDSSRAPAGRHTLWAYCHVPNGSTFDMTERMEQQIERFAPGFRERVLARSVRFPADMERHNENLIGGDIAGGAGNLKQFFERPVLSLRPYTTAVDNVYLCSSSTPPGVGVHGMCGHFAARAALRSSLR